MRKLTKIEKIRRGTLIPSRENRPILTAFPLTERPEPMHQLDEVAQTYFDYAADLLISAGTLTELDVPGLTRAAQWYSTYRDALKQVTEVGTVQRTSTGYTTKTGAYCVLTESERILFTWERSVGLNIAGRSKLPPPEPAPVPNPFDEF